MSRIEMTVADYEEFSVQFAPTPVLENVGIVQAFLARGTWDDLAKPLTVAIRSSQPRRVGLPGTVLVD